MSPAFASWPPSNDNPAEFVTNAEVFQEIMHHYRRTERWEAGRVVVESFAAMMHGRVSPVIIDDVLAAGLLANTHRGLSTRDLLHLAVMRRLGVTRIVTADADFDRAPGIIRLDPPPTASGNWRERRWRRSFPSASLSSCVSEYEPFSMVWNRASTGTVGVRRRRRSRSSARNPDGRRSGPVPATPPRRLGTTASGRG